MRGIGGVLAPALALSLLAAACLTALSPGRAVELEEGGAGGGGGAAVGAGQAGQAGVKECCSPGTTFKFSKFGPLRNKQWQSSRYRVLALWEAASRSLESCMSAEDFIYPHAQDTSCTDVVRTFDAVRGCMKYQRDGLQGLATGPNGGWQALSDIVDETKALGTEDRKLVGKKISSDAVLYTLARLDALHAKCAKERFAQPSSAKFAPHLFAPTDPVFQAERAIGYVRGQEPEVEGDAAGEWPVRVDLGELGAGAENGGAYGEPPHDGWDSIRRMVRRGYTIQPADESAAPLAYRYR